MVRNRLNLTNSNCLGPIFLGSHLVLHPWGVIRPGDETVALIEGAFAACAEKLDIAETGSLAPLDQLLEELCADALPLIGGVNDQVIDHSVQDAVGQHAPKANQLFAIVGANHELAAVECTPERFGGAMGFAIPAGRFKQGVVGLTRRACCPEFNPHGL